MAGTIGFLGFLDDFTLNHFKLSVKSMHVAYLLVIPLGYDPCMFCILWACEATMATVINLPVH